MPPQTRRTTASSPAHDRGRLPVVVLLLTVGTFLMNTTEFMIAGLLPEMAADFVRGPLRLAGAGQ